MQNKSYARGAFTLALAGVLVKVIGVVYRVVLGRFIGDGGLGIYYKAFPIYAYLLVLSTAGIPPAVSKLVAQYRAKGDKGGAQKVFRTALTLTAILGFVIALTLFIFREPVANLSHEPRAALAIGYIAPAIFFVAVLSVIRGYFQGMHHMFPTAMSQMVEQIGKVVMGLYFASMFLPQGIAYGAAGAVLGMTLSEALALLIMVIYYAMRREIVPRRHVGQHRTFAIMRKITGLAVPILLGASVMPLVMLLDSYIISDRLISIGYSHTLATEVYGLFSGRVNPLANVPGVVSLALCVSVVPAISAAHARGSSYLVKRNTHNVFKMAMLIGLPSAAGLVALATPIIRLLYSNFSIESNVLAGNLLTILAGGVVFLSILQVFNGVLQGLGRVKIPVIALSVGALVKVVVGYTLTGIPSIHIYGAPISTVACYMVASIIDIIMIKRYTGVSFNLKDTVLKPLLASVIMGAGAWGMYALLFNRVRHSVATLAAVLFGAVIFMVCIPALRLLSRDEVLKLPMGASMVRLYDLLG